MSKVLVYQHIPKCGGTAFREACGRMFPVMHEPKCGEGPFREADGGGASVKIGLAADPSLGDEGILMITGHYVHDGVRPWERFADWRETGQKLEWLTVLREPLARVISSFKFRKQRDRKVPQTLESWVERKRNTQARYLGFEEGSAEQFLERYCFVGITEQLQGSVDLLAAQLACESTKVELANVSTGERAELAPGVVEKFRERNDLDYQLYEAGLAWLEGARKRLNL